jgi:hypothetical protein
MKKIQIIIILITVLSCSSTKKAERLPIDGEIDDSYIKEINKNYSLQSITTDFYNIVTLIDTKSLYVLDEFKKFDIRIINYGQKEFFLPEWLSKSEFKIDLYKKIGKDFKSYKQKSMILTKQISSSSTKDRIINSSKNGELICFKDLELDRYLPIVDEGIYYAKITIDLSNFGYFKPIVKQSNTFTVKK